MRRFKRRLCAPLVLLLCAPVVLFALSPAAAAPAAGGDAAPWCACCASRGDWYMERQAVGASESGELGMVRLGPSASLRITEAGFDGVRGIADPSETYTLAHTRRGRAWTLRFSDARGRSGTLSFTLPAAMTHFAADLQEGGQALDAGPILYREWRLEGPVAGTGIFRLGARRGTRFRLVLQGRGNSCASAADFKSWNLQVYAADQLFTFYGPVAAAGAGGR